MTLSFHHARACLTALVAAAALLAGCAGTQRNMAADYEVTVKRTSDGVPHIRAKDWDSLGYGVGYTQAQDDLCTLADSFVTWRGERSMHFGADARAIAPSSFGQPRNLDSDFFFRFMADDAAVARYRAAQPAHLRALIDGYADGYDRYVDDLRNGRFPGAHLQCVNASWARRITRDDVYRRLIALSLAGGAARFLEGIVNAAPPGASKPAPTDAVSMNVGGHVGIGSNALAFGGSVTGDGKSLLFGNPHWFWSGPDRFYQAQLTIPGQLDVAGVSFLAVPVIVIGFNGDIAWSHTVSSARRFGIFELKLAPGQPTHYRYDGKDEALQAVPVTVQTRDASNHMSTLTRTLYRSRFGPMVDLSPMAAQLGWNTQHAFALRDVNADNTRAFGNFLAWNQARSLDDFIAIQKRYTAMPWVNTFAIGRNDARAWFADIGAVPAVPDTLAARCTTPLGRAFAVRAPGVPFLDGSRSACAWGSAEEGASNPQQADALPAARMPSLLSTDYVGNFNGSYWLTNPRTPLTGFDRVMGETGTAQSLRTRLGHALAAGMIGANGGVTRDSLERAVLHSDSMSERLFRQPLVDSICREGNVPHAVKVASATIDLEEPCRVLRAWDGTGNTDARGANLWDQFWRRASDIPDAQLYAEPFDPAHPLTTPSGLKTDNPALVQALAAATLALRHNGFALDSTRGEVLHALDADTKIPLYGGCDPEGYFTVACPLHDLDKRGLLLDRDAHGNSYVQVVGFDANGPQADTLLAHSESDDPASPHHRDDTKRYARKEWTRFAFTQEAVDASPNVVTMRLEGRRSASGD